MSETCLSVVIPAFNREREVGRAIESCLRQGFDDFQIVVVDDGSTDRTCDAVRSFPDERICLVRHPANRGECPARNTGVAHATADWVLFLDSDDELLPDAMGTIAEKIRSCPPDIARLAFCYRRDDGRVSPSPRFQQEVVDYDGFVRWTNNVQLSDFLQCVRRETFDHLRFPESRMHALPYNYDFSRRFKTRFYPEVLATLHLDATVRESEGLRVGGIRWGANSAVDRAEGMTQLLEVHAKTLRENAPHSLEVYSRMRATYRFLAGDRRKGVRLAMLHLTRYPLSIHSWVIPVSGIMGSRALRAGTRLKAWAVESRGWAGWFVGPAARRLSR